MDRDQSTDRRVVYNHCMCSKYACATGWGPGQLVILFYCLRINLVYLKKQTIRQANVSCLLKLPTF